MNGTENPYLRKARLDLMNKERKIVILKYNGGQSSRIFENTTFAKLESECVESYRIGNPDDFVILVDGETEEHYTHLTWRSQMEYTPGFQTFTSQGYELAKKAMAHHRN